MDKHRLYLLGRFIFVVSVVIITYFIIKYTVILFYPFVVAILLSFVIEPFVSYLRRKTKLPRLFTTIIVFFIFFSFLIGLIMLIISEVIQGSMYLAEKLPAHYKNLLVFIKSFLTEKIIPIYHKVTSFTHQYAVNEYIEEIINDLASAGTVILREALLTFSNIVSLIPYSFTVMILIIIAAFLITNDWDRLRKLTNNLIPASMIKVSKNILIHIEKSFLGYLKAQFILILFTATIILIGLLTLRINHAFTISLLIAFLDFIPFVGIGIVFLPWIVYLFLIQQYSLTIGLTILYMIIIVFRQLLEPKILSSKLGLNPLLTLVTLFICIRLWGVLGVIIAPFLLVLTSAIIQAGIPQLLWKYIRG